MDIWCNRPVNTGAIFSVWLMTYTDYWMYGLACGSARRCAGGNWRWQRVFCLRSEPQTKMAQAAEQKAAIIWNDLQHVELKQKHLINMINALFVSRTSQICFIIIVNPWLQPAQKKKLWSGVGTRIRSIENVGSG